MLKRRIRNLAETAKIPRGKTVRTLSVLTAVVVAAALALVSPVLAAQPAMAASCNTTATYSWANNCWVSEGSVNRMVEVVQMVIGGNEICGPPHVGPVDGDFGPKTLAGVECFQSFEGLTVDGIVGPQTWSALESALYKCSEVAGFQYWSPIYPCPGVTGHTDPIREYLSTGIWWFFSPISNEWWRMNTTAPV